MTKLQFVGWGLAESDLDLGTKLSKLELGGVGGIRPGLGRKNVKVAICGGGGGVGRIRPGLGRKNDKVTICRVGVGGIRLGLGNKTVKVGIGGSWRNQTWTWEEKCQSCNLWGGGLAESDLDLGGKMTKLQFVGWGLAESDLDLGTKLSKLELGGVGGIRPGLGRKNVKVAICGGGGGWQNQTWTWEEKMTKLQFVGEGGG